MLCPSGFLYNGCPLYTIGCAVIRFGNVAHHGADRQIGGHTKDSALSSFNFLSACGMSSQGGLSQQPCGFQGMSHAFPRLWESVRQEKNCSTCRFCRLANKSTVGLKLKCLHTSRNTSLRSLKFLRASRPVCCPVPRCFWPRCVSLSVPNSSLLVCIYCLVFAALPP